MIYSTLPSIVPAAPSINSCAIIDACANKGSGCIDSAARSIDRSDRSIEHNTFIATVSGQFPPDNCPLDNYPLQIPPGQLLPQDNIPSPPTQLPPGQLPSKANFRPPPDNSPPRTTTPGQFPPDNCPPYKCPLPTPHGPFPPPPRRIPHLTRNFFCFCFGTRLVSDFSVRPWVHFQGRVQLELEYIRLLDFSCDHI